MKLENDLDTDDIRGLVLRLALPSMLAQFVSVFYSIVDRMYIGNIPKIGEVALAGVGICGPIVTLVSSFAILVGVGGAPLMSIRLGQKNEKGARQILANCFLMLTVMALVLTVCVLGMREKLHVVVRRWGDHLSLCVVLHDYLPVWHVLRADDYGHEPVYHLPGLCKGWHEGRYDRGGG